ncbi:MAG: sugar porter family MFS transporter [Candidatus Hydrogenedentes bacterium]|nr:sugar porter family MFS transporter [Candidatus Hydrogenedentota bacterium]
MTTETTEQDKRGSIVYLTGVCLVATLGGLLFGYDTAVISGAVGFLAERYSLDPAGIGWAVSSALVGCIIGVSIAGEVTDRLGRKQGLILAAALFFISAVGTALPRNLAEFVVYRIVGGVGVGIASMASPIYIAEISPAAIRGRMVSFNQLAIVLGMFVVYFVNYFVAGLGDHAWNVTNGWRWMFGSEAFPALGLLVLMFFVPNSPRFLVKQGRTAEAFAVLERVGGTAHAKAEVAEIEQTIKMKSGTMRDLLQPGVRLLLVVGIALAVFQQVTGINVFLYYAPEIFKKLGTDTDVALLQTIVVGGVNMLFTFVAIFTVDKIGRKPLMLAGFAGMGICLFSMGVSAYLENVNAWMLIFVLGYIACFATSVGPVTWVILSEIFPTKVRGRALAIATFFLWTANYVVSQTFPMMAENAYLQREFHGGFPFWVYGALCVVSLVFVFYAIPETKGRSLEEIERSLGARGPRREDFAAVAPTSRAEDACFPEELEP